MGASLIGPVTLLAEPQDTDDGSCFFDTHDNVLIAAASDANYGGYSLKSDFGGHSNFHHDNLDLCGRAGMRRCRDMALYRSVDNPWLGVEGSGPKATR